MAYNPSKHTASNKPYGTRGKALDARSYFYDEGVSFRYRPFQNIPEVLAYLPTADDRRGSFEVIINTGGTIQSSGYITGGTNDAYWFKDGLADGDLVLKIQNVDLAPIYEALMELNEGLEDEITRSTQTDASLLTLVNTAQTDINDHTSNTSNPHNTTKDQVGLGQVDNTSDANKPISDATQLALDDLGQQIDNVKQPYNLDYTQVNLLDTGGDGNYYLQLPDGISIIESKINNIGYNLTRDNTFTPNRLYGFANNSTQTIQLTVI